MRPPKTTQGSPAPAANAQGTSARGIVLCLIAVLFFSGIDSSAKNLSQFYPVAQVVWARYAFQVLLSVGFIPLHDWRAVVRPRRFDLQMLRSTMLLGATGCFFTAIHFMPLADATALTFIGPLLVVLLSALFLGERIGPRRLTAVAIGLVSVLIIVRPGAGVFHWAAILALTAATCMAVFQIATRKLATVAPAHVTLLHGGLVGVVVMTPIMPFVWQAPSLEGWFGMAVLGGTGAIGHFLFIRALAHATPAAVAPYFYVHIVYATAWGYLLFGDLPDGWTVTGAAMIIASGLYIYYREATLRRRRPT